MIHITGGTLKMRLLTEAVVSYCFRDLLPKKRTIHLDVSIQNVRKTGAQAYAESWIEDRKRLNAIEIDNQPRSLYEYIVNLCHEFVHIKQYTLGELLDKEGKTLWKGVDHSETAYCRQPWEKEAFAMEHKLASHFIRKTLKMTIKAAKQTSARTYYAA